METGTTGQNTGNTAGGAGGAGGAQPDFGQTGAEGNDNLSQAFDSAITAAKRTLELTTVKGADLYALKQSVR